ncbi:MAG: HDOD domain-containing protein [Oleispira antarctica]|uniref:Putative signal transduction protein n=1 Tax=Oleispira antarctica RB-8 TaxID=698738 RepID=R4YLN8_OLEAN|nr:HDOD domain-containing protein [Oleispira antarctica]MBQ0794028.1 HDOD domain-containing protein [Oleispira antarctica]CCK75627.1 putative signal transduction protein [Oleispira antarctica RB-8]|tara:strand:- start:1585 stop:2427 length:843 start_codon:yes stop_codon:yes gene_type:complete
MAIPLVQQVKQDIIQALENDELVLPTLPEIALQVREVAENVTSSISDLTKILGRDAALSARMIKVANSPLIRTSSPVSDLNTAVSRLGIDLTSNLAMGLAMEQMFQATSDVVDKRMRSCWSKSVEIAASSQVLARHFTNLQPDQALLAGLIHQIGKLPILAFAENNESLLNDSFALGKVLSVLHPSLGSYILKMWDFPEELVAVPKNYLIFDRTVDKVDYADIVQVATLQSYAGTDHPYTKLDWTKISSFDRLGLDPTTLIAEMEGISEEVTETQGALGG